MQKKAIHTNEDYQLCLRRFEQIFQAKAGSAESAEADILSTLIKEYEDKHFVIDYSNTIVHNRLTK